MSGPGSSDDGELLAVRVMPRARQDEIAGMREGVLLVRTTAPPQDGRANAAVLRLIAKRLGIARTRVVLVAGARSREKLLRIEGLTGAEARERLLSEG
jgi:uncharacterized protein (TIGR00251 family)